MIKSGHVLNAKASPVVHSSGRAHLQSAWIGETFPKWCFVSSWICFRFCLLYTVSNHNSDGGVWNSLPVADLVRGCPFIPGCHSAWLELLPALLRAGMSSSSSLFICWAFLPLVLKGHAGVTWQLLSWELLLPEPLGKPKEHGEGLIYSFTDSIHVNCLFRAAPKKDCTSSLSINLKCFKWICSTGLWNSGEYGVVWVFSFWVVHCGFFKSPRCLWVQWQWYLWSLCHLLP